MDLKEFIKNRKHLVWDVKNYSTLSDEAVVEAVLNYGDWSDFKALLKILGVDTVATLFFKGISKRRCNYREKTKQYFSLYFSKHAPHVQRNFK